MRQSISAAILGVTIATFGIASASADHLNIDVGGVKHMGNKLIFKSVKIDKPGFLVIHEMKAGNPVIPQSIGNVAVKPGVSENVTVTLANAAKNGTELMAMLHEDTNNNGKYEFGVGKTDVDTPALTPDKAPYVKIFKVGM